MNLWNNNIILFFTSVFMIRSGLTMIVSHYKCRGGTYPRTQVFRFPVPDDKVSWSVSYPDYSPPSYTSPVLEGKPWADPDIADTTFQPQWNTQDELVNRESYLGKYKIVKGYPRNPIGRTGLTGRGVLGRWGPNHAADPVVTKWKRGPDGNVLWDKNSPILQFVAIKRRDSGVWALPGGMVDPGEHPSAAAVREFQEEAADALNMTKDHKDSWELLFRNFFAGGVEVYSGYIDDPRNTDNAWMESVAYNYHDDDGKTVEKFELHAGDDAVGVRWVDIDSNINLHASHKDIVLKVLKLRLDEKKE